MANAHLVYNDTTGKITGMYSTAAAATAAEGTGESTVDFDDTTQADITISDINVGMYYDSVAGKVQHDPILSSAEQLSLWDKRIGTAYRHQQGLVQFWWADSAGLTSNIDEHQTATRATIRWIAGNGYTAYQLVRDNVPTGASNLTLVQKQAVIAKFEEMGQRPSWATAGNKTGVSHWYRQMLTTAKESVSSSYAGQSLSNGAALYSDIYNASTGVALTAPTALWTPLTGMVVPTDVDLEAL